MTVPTNEDIEELLATVDKPGKKRTEKKELIKQKYPNLSNSQGIKLYDVLESYRNY